MSNPTGNSPIDVTRFPPSSAGRKLPGPRLMPTARPWKRFAAQRIANDLPVIILQIVPRVPGGLDGVGDYALNLAAKFRDGFGCDTVFAAPAHSPATSVRGFEVRSLENLIDDHVFDRIILHYVNYGFEKRGIPFGLLAVLR